MSKFNLVTDSQGLWLTREARRLGISAVDFQNNRGRISAFLANLSPLVSVDRSQSLIYPDWVDKPLYPELEARGPKRFDASRLEQWFHPNQKNNWVKGVVIHEYLRDQKLLPTCLGLRELLAIQAKGLEFFRRYFQSKAVFGWKGCVRHRDGSLSVPYLVEDGVEAVLSWYWLESAWRAFNPALRLAK